VNRSRSNQGVPGAAVAAVFLMVAGCQDPRFKQKQALRDAGVAHHVSSYAAYDAAGPERIRKTLDLHDQLAQRREEQLEATRALIHRSYEERKTHWEEHRPKRRAFCKSQLHGKPDTIDETFATMFY
jgi:hypothetical protein